MLLDHIRFVLVKPSHPGNIGAAARAMKVMGLKHMVLVKPKLFPNVEATAMASGADDILASAEVVDDLQQAVSGCHFVVGCSVRDRTLNWPCYTARNLAESVVERQQESIAIVFGSEQSGLSNEELAVCQAQCIIPVVENFSSLNLAAAIQVIAYECFMATQSQQLGQKTFLEPKRPEIAQQHDLHRLYAHLEDTLHELDFLDPNHPKKLMQRLRHLFNRAELDDKEVNILRGILSAVNKKTQLLSHSE